MSSFANKLFLQIRSPIVQFKRFRGKINIQRPRQPHYERARVIAVTTPYYKDPEINELCLKTSLTLKEKIDNPYEKIIAREVLNWFNHSQVIGIFHLNSISSEDFFKVRVAFHKQNMQLKIYGKSIMKQAITDTKYEKILPLFESKNCIVFSQENKIKQIIKIIKKVPQMILIAGIAENQLLSKTEFTDLATMPDLQIMRSQLVAVLNSAAGNLVNHLECHQNSLVNILDAHVKLNQVKTEETAKEENVIKDEKS